MKEGGPSAHLTYNLMPVWAYHLAILLHFSGRAPRPPFALRVPCLLYAFLLYALRPLCHVPVMPGRLAAFCVGGRWACCHAIYPPPFYAGCPLCMMAGRRREVTEVVGQVGGCGDGVPVAGVVTGLGRRLG